MAEHERGKWLRESRAGYLTVAERDSVITFLDQLENLCGDQVARVILFGSRARGDYDAESDIDLLIVTRNGHSEVDEIARRLRYNEPYLSVHVMSSGEYRTHQRRRDPLYINVRRDGIELWNPNEWLREQQTVPLNIVEGEFRTMDEAAKETIHTYLGLADYGLREARVLRDQGLLRGANSRAYYGAHYALVAALYSLNVVRSKHSGIEAAISQFMVKPGLIEEEFKDIFVNLRARREDSDYNREFVPNEDETRRLVQDAERFVARMEKFLREQGAFDDNEEDQPDSD
ncbi:MAG: nucleotidyltransferase domain-containing protein [Anaerolineae bacterium]